MNIRWKMMNNSFENLPRQVSPRWEVPATVANFRANDPNFVLMDYARELQQRKAKSPLQVLDIGGGAGRNAVPLAKMGFRVVCTDLSAPMLIAAQDKAQQESVEDLVSVVQCPMAPLPFDDQSFDLIIAHGIWNLARSGTEFRAAVAEAARVAKPGAGLFLFTFSRHTIPETDAPVAGETFVFTQFNGEPQCFLTEEEIISELGRFGFMSPDVKPLTEYNRSATPRLSAQGPPVLYEGTFTRQN